MEPTSREDLSALMDGELGAEPTRFLLRRLDRQPELAQTWSRWHLIRACLAKQHDSVAIDPHSDAAFAARVLNAVQARPRTRRWARFAGGGAIAASVAAAALILSVPQSTSTDTQVATRASSNLNTHNTAAAPRIAAATIAPRAPAALPWLNRAPIFLAARPATANAALTGGLLQQPGYLQTAAYAPDAAPMLVPHAQQAGEPPYLILLVPDNAAAPSAQHH